MKPSVVIVDYGMGNLGSVANALTRLDASFEVSSDPRVLKGAAGILLPGVGAFPRAMKNLHESGLAEALTEQVVHQKKPFLGICLGMQLIAQDSVEGEYTRGLGWVPGNVVKIERPALPVPHVGWNQVGTDGDYYFDHSYQFTCPSEWIAGTCDYGGELVAIVHKENITAVQFHPEKSQRTGLKLLRRFLNSLEVPRC